MTECCLLSVILANSNGASIYINNIFESDVQNGGCLIGTQLKCGTAVVAVAKLVLGSDVEG